MKKTSSGFYFFFLNSYRVSFRFLFIDFSIYKILLDKHKEKEADDISNKLQISGLFEVFCTKICSFRKLNCTVNSDR